MLGHDFKCLSRQGVGGLIYFATSLVDDPLWDSHAIATEQGINEEFESYYHYNFESDSGAFHDDINKLFQALQIVDNNAPENIGGGGKLLQPLAPAIGN
jgi:hypothetical protein